MAGPPTNIEPSKLWAALQQAPRPFRVIDFPRQGPTGEPVGQVAIWVLTQEELMIASAEAEKFAREKLKAVDSINRESFGYDNLYAHEASIQILYRACRDVDDPERRSAFPSPGHIRQHMTSIEVGTLFAHYLTVQAELGPLAATLSDEEIDAWITRIAEGGSAYPFDLLPSELQRTLVLTMARRLRSSSTGTSSAGSPPSDTSTG